MQDVEVPVSLRIPPMDGNPLQIYRRFRPAFRGAAERRKALLEVEEKQRAFEALMHTIVTCGALWGGFWIQFLVGVMYGIPALHTLSRGGWYAPFVGFYLPVHSHLSLSLAENFAWLSFFGSLMALLGVWHWTRGVRGRWRMRILVCGFAGFLSLWSLAALAGQNAAWQALEDRLRENQREMQKPQDQAWLDMLKNENEWIKHMLETRPKD